MRSFLRGDSGVQWDTAAKVRDKMRKLWLLDEAHLPYLSTYLNVFKHIQRPHYCFEMSQGSRIHTVGRIQMTCHEIQQQHQVFQSNLIRLQLSDWIFKTGLDKENKHFENGLHHIMNFFLNGFGKLFIFYIALSQAESFKGNYEHKNAITLVMWFIFLSSFVY